MLGRFALSVAAAFFVSLGLIVAQLLFWPHVRPDPIKALVATVAWGSWGALWLGIATFLIWQASVLMASLFRLRVRTSRFVYPAAWLGFFAAVVIVYNQRLTRQLLPKSSRQALMVLAVLALLWALSWLLLPRRALKPWVFTLLLSLWVVAVWLPWWGVPPASSNGKAEVSFEVNPRPRRALIVLWEGADAPWLLPMMDRGVMPFLKSIWSAGSWGQIRTVRPFSRAASLTTLATGCLPVVHQVAGRRAYRLPFLSTPVVSLLLAGPWPTPHQLPWRLWERAAPPLPKVPLLWEVFTAFGVSCQVVGWPLVNQLTDEVAWATGGSDYEGLPIDPSWQALIRDAVAPHPERAHNSWKAFSLAATRGVEAALAVQQVQPQVLILHQDLPNRLRPMWSGEDPGDVLRLAAQLLDSQLAELWRLFGNDQTYLLLVSPYGMAPPGPWDRLLANLGLGSRWAVSTKDSPEGFFFLMGPGVAKGSRVRSAGAADLMPTLFYFLELPIARKLSGRVLLPAVDEAWAGEVPMKLIPVYPKR